VSGRRASRVALLLATACALLAPTGCKRGPKPPPCDTTACCELYQQQVYESCTAEQDEVYGCDKQAKHAYEACIEQLR